MHFGRLTTRWQTCAGGAVEAGLFEAGVGVEHAAQLQLREAHHLGVARTLVLQRQLVVVEHHRVQAALEAVQHQRTLLGVRQTAGVGGLHLERVERVEGGRERGEDGTSQRGTVTHTYVLVHG